MKFLGRALMTVMLMSFMSLAVAEGFHHHKDLQSQSDCSFCKIVHQAVALVNSAPTTYSEISVSEPHIFAVPHPYLQFVFPSHGLSPPTR